MEHGLRDEDFWVGGEARDLELDARLYDAGLRGALLAAPRFVALDARDTLPVLVARVATCREAAAVRFSELAVLAAVDLATSEVRAAMLVEPPDGYVPRPRGPLPADLGDGELSEIHHAELRRLLGLPWRPASLLLTMVLRDAVSNRVRVEIGRSAQSYRDPEVERFLESMANRSADVEPSPAAADPLPCFRRLEQSPPTPASPGIALAGDRVVVLEEHARLVLRGSFRLSVAPREIVPAPDRRARVGSAERDLDRPSAVVPVSLLIVGADHASPTVVALRVPSWDAVGSAGSEVTGHFAIDLLAAPGMPRQAQTYFVLAFHGEHLAGPLPMALVDPLELPSWKRSGVDGSVPA